MAIVRCPTCKGGYAVVTIIGRNKRNQSYPGDGMIHCTRMTEANGDPTNCPSLEQAILEAINAGRA